MIKRGFRGYPGSSVVKNPLANAGDVGSTPGPEGSHRPQLLSLCSRTREPQTLSPLRQLLKPEHLEPVPTRETTSTRSPCTSTRE